MQEPFGEKINDEDIEIDRRFCWYPSPPTTHTLSRRWIAAFLLELRRSMTRVRSGQPHSSRCHADRRWRSQRRCELYSVLVLDKSLVIRTLLIPVGLSERSDPDCSASSRPALNFTKLPG